MNRLDILFCLSLWAIICGGLLALGGMIIAGNSSDLIEFEGEVIEKISYATSRRDIVVRLDNGDVERDAHVDDQKWYSYEMGDRMPIELYVADPDERKYGFKLFFSGLAISGCGWLVITFWGRRWPA